MDKIIRLDATIRAAGIPIDGVSGNQSAVRVDYQTSATDAQKTQGASIVASFDWSDAADATWLAQQAKVRASSDLDSGNLQSGGATNRIIFALAQMILDEFNLHTAFEGNMLSAVAAATSLADLKTRFAAITPVPARTQAQVITAIKNKIAATAE